MKVENVERLKVFERDNEQQEVTYYHWLGADAENLPLIHAWLTKEEMAWFDA